MPPNEKRNSPFSKKVPPWYGDMLVPGRVFLLEIYSPPENVGEDDPILSRAYFFQMAWRFAEMFFNATVRTETRRSANLGVAHVPGLPNLRKVSRCSRMYQHVSSSIILYHHLSSMHHPTSSLHFLSMIFIPCISSHHFPMILSIFTPHAGVPSTSPGRPATKVVPWKSYERTCLGHKATMAAGCGLWVVGGRFQVTGVFWVQFLGDDDFGVKCSWIMFLKFKKNILRKRKRT